VPGTLKWLVLWRTMKKKFIRTLVVVLAAFGTLVFVYPDDLWEYDTSTSQSDTLRESSGRLPNYRDHQAVGYSALFVASSKGKSSQVSGPRTLSPPLVSLSTCVLLC
jgi:hypothetical protein